MDPVAGLGRAANECRGDHGLADPRRPDEQRVGGVVEKAPRREAANGFLIDAGLGGEVDEFGVPSWLVTFRVR